MRTKISLIFLTLAISVSFICMGGALASEQKTLNWKCVVAYPKTDPVVTLMQKDFCDVVEKESKGRLKIRLYSAGELMSPSESLDACSKGIIQMESSVGAYWQGKDPLWIFDWGVPFTSRDNREMFNIMDHGLRDILVELFDKYNLHYLAPAGYGHHLLFLKKPVRQLSDFKGMKLRGIGPVADMLNELGAATVFITGSELYSALQLGTIDGAGWSNGAWEEMHWDEVVKYVMFPPIMSNYGHIAVNKNAWASLPDDLKCIVKSCAERYGETCDRKRIASQRRVYGKLVREQPERVLVLPAEEVAKMRDVAKNVWTGLSKKSPKCAEAMKIIEDYLKEHPGMCYEYPH